jgi:hypothetical protein
MGRRRSRPSAVQKGLVLIRWIGEKSKDEKKSKPLMAQDFYYATTPDGYKTYVALRELFEPETEKGENLLSASYTPMAPPFSPGFYEGHLLLQADLSHLDSAPRTRPRCLGVPL